MQDSDNDLPVFSSNGVIVSHCTDYTSPKEVLCVGPFMEFDLPLIHFGGRRDVMVTESSFSRLLITPTNTRLEEWVAEWTIKNKASKLEKEQRGKRKHNPRLHVESLASRDQIKKERIQALLNKRKTRS